jgi:aminobenzoyl-glutamate transport protein
MTDASAAPQPPPRVGGFLGAIERAGNRLPDPVFIFVWLITGLIVVSVIAAIVGASAVNPVNGEVLRAESLLSGENLRTLFVDMPRTLTGFAPLGYVLVVMLGAGVAERSGLFSTAMRSAVSLAPQRLLTPAVVFIAIVANHAADAAYVVLIPLAGALFFAAGRHPIAGIAAAFAGVSGGFSANIFPGHLDALLLGITEPAAEIIDPNFAINIAGNWYFITAMALVITPVAWFVTDRIVEPRLGPWVTDGERPAPKQDGLAPAERKGLRRAGLAALLVIGAWAAMVFAPGAPLVDTEAAPAERLAPFYQSLVAAFFVLFLLCAVAYGSAAGTVKNHRDVVRMTTESMQDLGYYIVLAFVAAHFVAMFNWSNLGGILAIHGAQALRASGLPAPLLLMLIVVLAASINLLVGSASAKWAALAPVLVPMLMLLGISPYMTTAAYRMGDSVTNIITPLMVYFPLVLTFCQRWQKDFGLGSLMAAMLPYSLAFLISGLALTGAWVALEWPLGPGAGLHYELPANPGPAPEPGSPTLPQGR